MGRCLTVAPVARNPSACRSPVPRYPVSASSGRLEFFPPAVHPIPTTVIMTGNPHGPMPRRADILPVTGDQYTSWKRIRSNPNKIRPGPCRTVHNTRLKRKKRNNTCNEQQESYRFSHSDLLMFFIIRHHLIFQGKEKATMLASPSISMRKQPR